MRTKTLEIRWHDTLPIFSSDFQPLPAHQLKKLIHLPPASAAGKEKEIAHSPAAAAAAAPRSYRLATAGGDNHVRLWLIHPNHPHGGASSSAAPPPARAEFLATLKRHTAAVNVVRWSPKDEVLASAGDDGFVMLWVPKPMSSDAATLAAANATSSAFGDSSALEDGQKEFWKVKAALRVTTNEIYDLAWSPDGTHFIVGSTDNTARIYNAHTGTLIKIIADHSHYVQGVAWDPLNEFIATQSSDRTVHIHRIVHNKGILEFQPHSRSQKMDIHHSRTPSSSSSTSTRPAIVRRQSTTNSDSESVFTSAASDQGGDDTTAAAVAGPSSSHGGTSTSVGPLTPSASQPGTPSMAMQPPSRRSSFSSSVAASPPPIGPSRVARSPSPLPAIRPAPGPSSAPRLVKSTHLFGDESYTHYFRRLTFSPDGALLVTPAGQIDDPHLTFLQPTPLSLDDPSPSTAAAKPKKPVDNGPKPTVYIYSRANLSTAPIAHLPGQKTASVAVKFSPIFYELRDLACVPHGVIPHPVTIDEKNGQEIKVSLVGGNTMSSSASSSSMMTMVAAEAAVAEGSSLASSAVAEMSRTPSKRALSPSPSIEMVEGSGMLLSPSRTTTASSPAPASVFALPYRMFFAVATQDAVLLYDTQQPSPVAIFVGLHYSGFTDLAWSPDGQTLMLSSIDGYCSVIVFDPAELGILHPTQQHQKQLQAIASHLSGGGLPPPVSSSSASHSTSLPPSPAHSHTTPVPPVAGTGGSSAGGGAYSGTSTTATGDAAVLESSKDKDVERAAAAAGFTAPLIQQPATTTTSSEQQATADPSAAHAPKKKRRIELTHEGGLD